MFSYFAAAILMSIVGSVSLTVASGLPTLEEASLVLSGDFASLGWTWAVLWGPPERPTGTADLAL